MPHALASKASSPTLMLAVAMAGFAGAWPAAAMVIHDIPLLSIATLRWAVALVPLMAIHLLTGGPVLPPRDARSLGFIAALAGSSVVGYTFTWLGGMTLASANNGVFLIPASMPIFGSLIGAVLLRERPNRRHIVSLGLGLLGLLVIIAGDGGLAVAGNEMVGNALFILTGALWAIYLALYRVSAKHLSPVAAMTYAATLGLAVLVLIQVWAPSSETLSPAAAVSRGIAGPMIYLGLGGTAIPMLLMLIATRRTQLATVARFGLLVPVLGMVLNASVMGDPITMAQMIGGSLTLVGVLIGSR